jgi:hypothetical protein
MVDEYDDVARSLGHLVIAFNELEVALGGALMHLLKQEDDVGAAFVAHLGASQKLPLLKDLEGKIDHEPTRREFHSIVERAAKINADRNRFIHSEYLSAEASEDMRVLLLRRLRDATMPVQYPITVQELSKKYIHTADPKEIMELADETAVLAIDLIQLSENLF